MCVCVCVCFVNSACVRVEQVTSGDEFDAVNIIIVAAYVSIVVLLRSVQYAITRPQLPVRDLKATSVSGLKILVYEVFDVCH